MKNKRSDGLFSPLTAISITTFITVSLPTNYHCRYVNNKNSVFVSLLRKVTEITLCSFILNKNLALIQEPNVCFLAVIHISIFTGSFIVGVPVKTVEIERVRGVR